jgi:hypothetical protein
VTERRVLYGTTIEGPDAGCYGCRGTGVHLTPTGPTLCSCVTCPDHHPDPCDCLDGEAGDKIAVHLHGVTLARRS